MTTTKKLLTILFTLTLTVSAFGQADTSKYVLTIKQGKYEKVGTQTFLLVPTTLTNNSPDTLKYLSTTCSWREFYRVDNDKISIKRVDCKKNKPIMLTLAPYKSVDTEIELVIAQTISKVKFKIGMNLLKIENENNLLDVFREKQKTKNIIWSNAIEM
jgi:hypothetical protein